MVVDVARQHDLRVNPQKFYCAPLPCAHVYAQSRVDTPDELRAVELLRIAIIILMVKENALMNQLQRALAQLCFLLVCERKASDSSS